jgi:hypothetical protein
MLRSSALAFAVLLSSSLALHAEEVNPETVVLQPREHAVYANARLDEDVAKMYCPQVCAGAGSHYHGRWVKVPEGVDACLCR